MYKSSYSRIFMASEYKRWSNFDAIARLLSVPKASISDEFTIIDAYKCRLIVLQVEPIMK